MKEKDNKDIQEFMDKVKSVIDEYVLAEKMTIMEAMAATAQITGSLLAFQDPNLIASGQANAMVVANIRSGITAAGGAIKSQQANKQIPIGAAVPPHIREMIEKARAKGKR
jgi:hypothetical protein